MQASANVAYKIEFSTFFWRFEKKFFVTTIGENEFWGECEYDEQGKHDQRSMNFVLSDTNDNLFFFIYSNLMTRIHFKNCFQPFKPQDHLETLNITQITRSSPPRHSIVFPLFLFLHLFPIHLVSSSSSTAARTNRVKYLCTYSEKI